MRVFAAAIHQHFFEHGSAQNIFGQHTAHCAFDDTFGESAQHLLRGTATLHRIARVAQVLLVGHLFARKTHFVGVEDDDIIAAIGMRGISRFVFAAQNRGYARGGATYYLPFQINDKPLAVGLCRFLANRNGAITQSVSC